MVILVSEKSPDLRRKGVVMTTAGKPKRPCRLLGNELRPKKRMSICEERYEAEKFFGYEK